MTTSPSLAKAELRGWQVAELAWAEFDAWLSSAGDDIQGLSILDQIGLYATATTKTEAVK